VTVILTSPIWDFSFLKCNHFILFCFILLYFICGTGVVLRASLLGRRSAVEATPSAPEMEFFNSALVD
jgi:hypothetical protein